MSEKESWIIKLLRWIGIVKSVEVDKNEMCKRASSICNKNCNSCIWGNNANVD